MRSCFPMGRRTVAKGELLLSYLSLSLFDGRGVISYELNLFIHPLCMHSCSVHRVVARVTQQGMSHAQMDVSNLSTNAPNRDQLSISSVKTKVIADGALASGRTAHVLVIKRDASLAGMGIKIRRPTIVPMKINQFQGSVAMRHQIVIICRKFSQNHHKDHKNFISLN
jgi:hypothetical protein